MKRKWIVGGLVTATLCFATWFFASHWNLESLVRQEISVRCLIVEYPVQSWIVGFVAYLAISLVPGTRGKALVCGWLFGFLPGLILVNGALTGAALIAFFLSRYLLRDAIAGRYSWQLGRVNRTLESEGAFYVILLRVVPVSFTLTNYLLGATNVRRKTFWWATHVGLLPSNIVFVNVGSRLPSLSEVVARGWTAVFSAEVLVSVVVLSVFSLAAPYMVRRWLNRGAHPARLRPTNRDESE